MTMLIMRNLKLIISYDGTEFQGWQTQPGFRTVQETIQKHIEKITNQKIDGFSQIHWGDKVTIAGKFMFDWMKLITDDKKDIPQLHNKSEIVYSELSNQRIKIPVIETGFSSVDHEIETEEEEEDLFIEHSNPVLQFYYNNAQIVNIFLLNLVLSVLFYFAFLV